MCTWFTKILSTILSCSDTIRTRNLDEARKDLVRNKFDMLAPTARVCFGKDDAYLSTYEDELKKSIEQVPDFTELFKNIVFKAQGLFEEEQQETTAVPKVSHKICLIRRRNESMSSRHVLSFTSDYVASLCAARFQAAKDEEILRLWNLFSRYGDARGMTGAVFEAHVHKLFRHEIAIRGESMFRSKQGKPYAWFCPLDGHPLLKEARDQQTFSTFNVEMPTGKIDTFMEGSDIVQVLPNTYYQPKKKQQVGIDSFFVHDGFLYLLQITGGDHHDIKDGLEPFVQKLNGIPTDRSKWRFVFVIPDELEWFECPKPGISVGTLFTAGIDMSLGPEM